MNYIAVVLYCLPVFKVASDSTARMLIFFAPVETFLAQNYGAVLTTYVASSPPLHSPGCHHPPSALKMHIHFIGITTPHLNFSPGHRTLKCSRSMLTRPVLAVLITQGNYPISCGQLPLLLFPTSLGFVFMLRPSELREIQNLLKTRYSRCLLHSARFISFHHKSRWSIAWNYAAFLAALIFGFLRW